MSKKIKQPKAPAAVTRKGRVQRVVRRLAPTTSEQAKQEIVNLWLANGNNEALMILKAYKIGLDEGRRESSNDPSSATTGRQ